MSVKIIISSRQGVGVQIPVYTFTYLGSLKTKGTTLALLTLAMNEFHKTLGVFHAHSLIVVRFLKCHKCPAVQIESTSA